MNNLSRLLFVLLYALIIAKTSGRGGGRGGGGRGSSGARSSSKAFSGGSKFRTVSGHSSSFSNFGSTSFRNQVFKPTTQKNYFASSGATGQTYVINKPHEPIVYDNHYYYWHGHYRSGPEKKNVCEYFISEDDGELMNVTFSNGTTPKSIMFGCGSWEKCCGMTCCSATGDWIGLSIWVLVVIFAIFYGCRKN